MIVANLSFFGPIVDLKVVDGWILVAQKDKVVLLDFEGDLVKSEDQQTIETQVNKRGLIDLVVVDGGVKVVVPYPTKKGHV